MADKKSQTKKVTPMDIHNQEFKKRGLSGYDRREVDTFLDQIVDDYGDTLDQNVDLKNEVIHLRNEVSSLQSQVTKYQQTEEIARDKIVDAQNKAQEIINNAKEEANNQSAQAKIDKDYQRQQLETITSDYDRVKREVAGYRKYIQELLQKAIKNLDDEDWQKALDKYFSTERFYPPDGSEPITLTDEEEVVDEDDDEVDNDGDIEVNFDEDIDEDDDDEPHPMEGDSPNVETINSQDTDASNGESGTTIIFPDDYKKHN